MLRLVLMQGTWYGREVDIKEDTDNIQEFVVTGDVVILVEDLSSIEDVFSIPAGDVVMADADE